MESGIYCIYWKHDDSKVYIGMSTNITNRLNKHYYELSLNIHKNSYLQNLYNIHGEPAYLILERCSTDKLSIKEISWIAEFDSYNNGYNLTNAIDLNGYGTTHSASKYSKISILKAFSLLYKGKESHINISNRTGISKASISAIYRGANHYWLKNEYPDKYTIMLNKASICNKKAHIDYTKVLNKYPDLLGIDGDKYSIRKNEAAYFAQTHKLCNKRLNALLHGKRAELNGWTVHPDSIKECMAPIGSKI